jgi:phage virion morphogenesis protein
MTVKGMQIEVNSRAMTEALSRLSEHLDDMTPVMKDIGALLESRIKERFETQSDPRGTPWGKPLWMTEPETHPYYPKDGNRRIFDRTGDMLNSLGWQADRNSVTVGFGQLYAAYHEFGTKKLPRRSLLFDNPETGTLAPDDETAIMDIISNYLTSALD